MDRSVVRELVEKAPRIVPGEGWHVHHVFFARAEAESLGAALVDLEALEKG